MTSYLFRLLTIACCLQLSVGENVSSTLPPAGATLFPPSNSEMSNQEAPAPPFNENNNNEGNSPFPPGTFPSYGNPSFPSNGNPSFPANVNPSFPSNGNPSFPSNGNPSFTSNGNPSFPPNGNPSFPPNGNPSFPSNGGGNNPSGFYPTNGNPSISSAGFPVGGGSGSGGFPVGYPSVNPGFPSAGAGGMNPASGFPGFNPAMGYPGMNSAVGYPGMGGVGSVGGDGSFPSAAGNPAGFAPSGNPVVGYPASFPAGTVPNQQYPGVGGGSPNWGSGGLGGGSPNWGGVGGVNGYVPPGAGYPQPPSGSGAFPSDGPSAPMDIKDLANSLLNDETTFDVYLVGADGTLVGANSLILFKISATFGKLIEEARREAAFAAAAGGTAPGGADNNGTASPPPPPPPVGGVGSPLEAESVAFMAEEDAERKDEERKKRSSSLANQAEPDQAATGGAAADGENSTPANPTSDPPAGAGAEPANPTVKPVEPPKYVILKMPFSVSTQSLRRFVRFLYTFEIEVVDARTRQELLFLSNYFDVPSLKEACRKFMSEKLSSENVFLYLEEALNMRVETMVEECLEIVRVNRNLFLSDRTFQEVTLQQMERILAMPELPITEEHLFNFVVEWTKRLANAGPQLEKMFKLIRFPTMRPRFLANVVSFSRVLPDYDLASIFTDALSIPPTPKFGIYSTTKRAMTPVLSVTSVEFGNFTMEYKDKIAIAQLRPHIVKIGGVDDEGYLLFGPDGRQLDETLSLSEAGVSQNDRIQLQAMIIVNVNPVGCSQCSGGPWKLQVREGEFVRQVKEMLSATQNIASSRISLRLGTTTLVDTERISVYGIVDGSEVEMIVKSFVVGDENVAKGGEAKASSVWGKTYGAEKAFEGSRSSLWVSKQMKNVPFEPQWIQYSLSSPLAVGKFAFQGTIWSRQLPTGPTKYQFQGSNDESTWATLFREENGAEWKSTSDDRVHLISDPRVFRHYRLLVTQTEWIRTGKYGRNEDYAVEVRNLRFYGVTF